MKKFINEMLMGISMPVVIGIAIIAVVATLIAGPGATAFDSMFDQAVTEISNEMK